MPMSDPEIENLINQLRDWCKEEYGRNSEVARTLGVSRQLISDWFAGRTVPSWAAGRQIEKFLKKQRRRRK